MIGLFRRVRRAFEILPEPTGIERPVAEKVGFSHNLRAILADETDESARRHCRAAIHSRLADIADEIARERDDLSEEERRLIRSSGKELGRRALELLLDGGDPGDILQSPYIGIGGFGYVAAIAADGDGFAYTLDLNTPPGIKPKWDYLPDILSGCDPREMLRGVVAIGQTRPPHEFQLGERRDDDGAKEAKANG